ESQREEVAEERMGEAPEIPGHGALLWLARPQWLFSDFPASSINGLLGRYAVGLKSWRDSKLRN
ncbi:MAG TPA: hypothetical protein PLD46_00890, partial [Hyphomicrobium sp.]|nr:hypothetical protein [Hyphomicrobium sp.]